MSLVQVSKEPDKQRKGGKAKSVCSFLFSVDFSAQNIYDYLTSKSDKNTFFASSVITSPILQVVKGFGIA